VDLVLFVVEAGVFNQADATVLDLLGKGVPTLLVANKLDTGGAARRSGALAARACSERHAFAEFVPMSAKNPRDVSACWTICEPYLPSSPGGTTPTN
jgi:GTP-binding protein Era